MIAIKRIMGFASLLAFAASATGQTLYSIGTPTNDEQYMLELINRARGNGSAEAARVGLSSLQEGPPSINGEVWQIFNSVQPLSWNPKLQEAAQKQADLLQNSDQGFSGQNPHTFGGKDPYQRIAAAGYSMLPYNGRTTSHGYFPGPENVSFAASTGAPYDGATLTQGVYDANVGLFVDNGMFGGNDVPGRGHRSTMMLEWFRELGIGISAGTDVYQGTTFNSLYIVQDYGTQTPSPTAGPFITGVVYHDVNGNGFYDPGEGLPGVTVNIAGSNFYAVTSSSGGYSVPVSADGTYKATFSGNGLPNNSRNATISAGQNAKLDDVVAPKLANISTRLDVHTGDDVLIGGFIITGVEAKRILLRAIGPSLPVANKLLDPILELRDSTGALVATNDNWPDAPNKQAIIDTGIPPTDARESAILATVTPGKYTAIVKGVNSAQGVALVEGYDLDSMSPTKFANISTRGFVETGENVMIGGFIVLQEAKKVIVRAIGPSLPVATKLSDPLLELHDANGGLLAFNDNWRAGGQEADITATGIPPSDDRESALLQTLTPGNYTAVVRGVNDAQGVALVEVYGLN